MSRALVHVPDRYVAKKAMFSFLGSTFRLFGPDGALHFFVKQKAFRLREEIAVFHDEAQTEKRLAIQARGIGDFSGTYDVTDASTGERLGALQRQGLKSIFKDEWKIFDPSGQETGAIEEVGGVLILLRRLFKFIPQKYEVRVGGALEGTIHQRFSFFTLSYDVDFSPGQGALDPRLGVAATVLLLAIEGRQE